jgi:hypothetical protein
MAALDKNKGLEKRVELRDLSSPPSTEILLFAAV